MTKLLIKLFIKDSEKTDDPAVRSRYGTLSGIVGILCNILLTAAKFIVGSVTGSIAITADARTTSRTLARPPSRSSASVWQTSPPTMSTRSVTAE